MSRRLTLIFSAALVVVAAFPTSPLAATASVLTFGGGHFPIRDYLSYVADAGETNQVEASVTEDHVVTIHDLGAVITAEAGCLSVDAHTVECQSIAPPGSSFPPFPIAKAVLMLGDLDDVISVPESFALFGVGVDVNGGPGADTLSSCAACFGLLDGDTGDDTLTGQLLAGGLGNDALSGGDRDDRLFGGPGNDTITAGGGSDFIRPGSGDDAVDAGAGNDLLDYFDEPGPMTVNLRTGVATGHGTDTFIGVEGVAGSRRGDLLIGDEHANTLNGGMGPDVIRGGPGIDSLFGGPGDDLDVVSGGGGDDIVHGGSGRDVLAGGPGDDRLSGLHAADLILGGRGNDVLNGGVGEDDLRGGRGNDRLSGGHRNDLLRGGPGHDRLFGEWGDDLLYARDRNRDLIRGGPGRDRARVDPVDSLFSVEVLF